MTVFEIIDAFKNLSKDEMKIFLKNIKKEIEENESIWN